MGQRYRRYGGSEIQCIGDMVGQRYRRYDGSEI